MAFTALTVAKFAVSGIVGIGANKIVKGIITNNVATPESPVDKVTITAASWVLSAIVSKASKNTTNEMIDDVYGSVSKIVSDMRESQKLNRINSKKSTFEDEGLRMIDYDLQADGTFKKKAVKETIDGTTTTETQAAS